MFGIAKGVLDEAILWTMSTSPRAEGGCLSTPLGYATDDTNQQIKRFGGRVEAVGIPLLAPRTALFG